jgi:predicted Zn-dependent protease with MMP-like domain
MNVPSISTSNRQPAPSFLSRKTAQQVDQAVQLWDRRIRKLMQQVTGLRLPSDRVLKINVQVDESVPSSLVEAIQERHAKGNAPNIEELFASYEVNDLTGLLQSRGVSFTGGSVQSHTSLEHNDILGAYFPENPRIELYWVLIGMFAVALECSVEELTCVVLAHEIGHAFTHLGRDLDNLQWDTANFVRAELTTIEGLAQFYTELTIKQMPRSSHRINGVFENLLQNQPQPYHKHRQWRQSLGKGEQNISEAIRHTMLTCRYMGTHGNMFDSYLSNWQD